jgi:hypothetical protein
LIHLYLVPALMTMCFLWGFRVCEKPFETTPKFLSDLGMSALIALLWPVFWVFAAAVLWTRHVPKGKT